MFFFVHFSEVSKWREVSNQSTLTDLIVSRLLHFPKVFKLLIGLQIRISYDEFTSHLSNPNGMCIQQEICVNVNDLFTQFS